MAAPHGMRRAWNGRLRVMASDVQKAMDWAMKNGLVSVFEEEAWTPKNLVNRSQAAQIIMNFVKKIVISAGQ